MRKPFPFLRPSVAWGIGHLLLFLLFFSLFFLNSHATREQGEQQKCYSYCGPLRNITYPFRLKQDPQGCGRPEPPFELTCENNNTQPVIHLPPRRYLVENISYEEGWILVLDPRLAASSLPLYSTVPPLDNYYYLRTIDYQELVFVNCSQPVNHPWYVATAPCNLGSDGAHIYALMNDSISVSQLHTSCMVMMNLLISDVIRNPTSCSGIRDVLMRGFRISWNFRIHGAYIPTNPKVRCFQMDYGEANEIFRMRRSSSSCKTLFQSFRCKFIVGFLVLDE